MRFRHAYVLLLSGLCACPSTKHPETVRETAKPAGDLSSIPSSSTNAATLTLTAAAAAVPSDSSAVPSNSAPLPPQSPPSMNVPQVAELLFLDRLPADAAPCMKMPVPSDAITCLLRLRYDQDPRTMALALDFYRSSGSIAGVEKPHTMDGGWRGQLQLVPELPIGRHRRHLTWVVDAYADFKTFFDGLGEAATRAYRYQPIELRFFRSVGRTTPSAYASPWTIAYNVSGSLHRNADAVRETIFHEIFHLNDRHHGQWSEQHLLPFFDAIVARCQINGRLSTACLRPYAPGDTMVRGGTYYAFQPGNGVSEYAAELAVRYYQEHRRVLKGRALAKPPFKCGPPPNREVWSMFVKEFFGGVDRIPACK